MKNIEIYGEIVKLNPKNRAEIKRLSVKERIPEELLAVIWGYISQAIWDSDRHDNAKIRRVSVIRIFEQYEFLLKAYSNRLEDIAEMLPEIGCRAATPESLAFELLDMLR